MGAYGKNAQLADFGIEYDMEVPHFNLSKQLDWFLEHNTGIAYIGDCAKNSGYNNLCPYLARQALRAALPGLRAWVA